MGQIIPIGNRILLKPLLKEEIEKKNDFGIILINDGDKEKSEQGIVIAIGKASQVKVGDRVVFSKYGYETVDEYYLIEEKNLLAIIK